MHIPIVIAPNIDEAALCAEVQRHLDTFWTEPGRLAVQSIGVIEGHLHDCATCQTRFREITLKQQPPWKNESTEPA